MLLTVNKKLLIITLVLAVLSFVFSGCRKDRTTSSFKPVPTVYSPIGSQALNKLDILWVIDNSGSMAGEQVNLGANFSSFVSSFYSRGYDVKLAVTVTDAYRANAVFGGGAALSVFKSVGACSGIYTPCSLSTPVVTFSTPNYLNTFVSNAIVGTGGNGDERSLSSMKEAFVNASNAGFLRSDSFLAVVILADEDDFSGNTRGVGVNDTHDYGAVTLDPISTYTTYLDTLTGTSGIYRRYNVSSIVNIDTTCAAAVDTRHVQIATDTNGVLGSICSASFASTLDSISAQITVLSTQFTLDHPAQPATIYVAFDGVPVPNNATNGWTYSSSLQAVQFHGTYTPTASTSIFIDYLPAY